MPGQEYKQGIKSYKAYGGTEHFTLLFRTIQSRMGDILMKMLDVDDVNELLRLQGRGRELNKMLDDLVPKTPMIKDRG